MKKLMSLILSIILAAGAISATAATAIQSSLTRNIKINGRSADGSFPNNPVIAGESTTTGLPNSNAVYVPILVQIDNNLGAFPQWGLADADIMYELPIAGQGFTRLTAFFSDSYPQEAGPVRSGRVMHADLREEWDALLVHYGKQEDPGSDMREALKEYGAAKKGLAADGIANMYKDYVARVKYHAAPHNVTAYIQKFRDLMITKAYPFPLRPFKFTDDLDYGGVPALKFNVIHKGNKDSSSSFVYDASLNAYLRFSVKGAYLDLLKPEQNLAYSNVIVQRTKLSWNNSSVAPLFNDIVGSGACDIFIGGQYIAGVWARNKMDQRTVFFDQHGNEISLQRGKTWIIICDETTQLIIGDLSKSDPSMFVATPLSETDPSLAKPITVTPVTTPQPANSGNASTPQPEKADEAAMGAVNTAQIKVAGNGLLNMRKDASKTSEIVSRIRSGSYVQVLSTDEEWTRIIFDGKEGYVVTDYLVFAQPQPVIAEDNQAGSTVGYLPLKLGDRGEDVLNLKKRLYELGYFRTTKLNERYMESTVEAVSEFEKRNSLPVDGIADVDMLTLLYSNQAIQR